MYDADGAGVMALRDVSLEIAAGEFCVLVGPSGCGKTTLLNCLAGFEAVTSGEIALDGAMLAAPGMRLLPGADRMVVFQGGALFPWKTVLWNVTCGPVLSGRLSRAEAEASARALLTRVGLAGIEGQYPGELSGGMKRRVEIIRALLNDPKVLLLDEPFRASARSRLRALSRPRRWSARRERSRRADGTKHISHQGSARRLCCRSGRRRPS